MNTPSHMILNLALLGRRSQPQFHGPIVMGALIPDAAMFVFYGWAKLFTGMSEQQIWGTAYFQPFWQDLFDIWNSIPLALLGIAMGFWLMRRPQAFSQWPDQGDARRADAQASASVPFHGKSIALFSTSILLHCLEDLPLHRADAHRHFWPLSNFRFESPISYWDPAHYGNIVGGIELALVLVSSGYIFRWIRPLWGKGLLMISNVLMVAAYIHFY